MAKKEDGTSEQSRPTIQVWVDAQLPPSLARWLRTEHDVDALHLQDLGLHQERDAVIYERARAENCAVVVLTKDDDFSKLLRRQGPPPLVVWLRCGNVKNQELRRIVLEAWPRTEALLAADETLVEIRRRGDITNRSE